MTAHIIVVGHSAMVRCWAKLGVDMENVRIMYGCITGKVRGNSQKGVGGVGVG